MYKPFPNGWFMIVLTTLFFFVSAPFWGMIPARKSPSLRTASTKSALAPGLRSDRVHDHRIRW